MTDANTDILLQKFQFLIEDFGFHVTASEVSQSFDNMWISLASDSLNVLVARDRGFIDAEVSPPYAPDRWLPVQHIRTIVLHRDAAEARATIDEQAEFVRSHFGEIVEMLSKGNLESTVERIHEIGRAYFNRPYQGMPKFD